MANRQSTDKRINKAKIPIVMVLEISLNWPLGRFSPKVAMSVAKCMLCVVCCLLYHLKKMSYYFHLQRLTVKLSITKRFLREMF